MKFEIKKFTIIKPNCPDFQNRNWFIRGMITTWECPENAIMGLIFCIIFPPLILIIAFASKAEKFNCKRAPECKNSKGSYSCDGYFRKPQK